MSGLSAESLSEALSLRVTIGINIPLQNSRASFVCFDIGSGPHESDYRMFAQLGLHNPLTRTSNGFSQSVDCSPKCGEKCTQVIKEFFSIGRMIMLSRFTQEEPTLSQFVMNTVWGVWLPLCRSAARSGSLPCHISLEVGTLPVTPKLGQYVETEIRRPMVVQSE
jgi:hypothetical protein